MNPTEINTQKYFGSSGFPLIKIPETNTKTPDFEGDGILVGYATYVLFDGQDREKRELIQGLNLKLYLKSKQIYNCVE